MKKAHLWILVAVTFVFTVFTAGFFLGRNQRKDAIVVSVPAEMQTAPSETKTPDAASTEALPPAVAQLLRVEPWVRQAAEGRHAGNPTSQTERKKTESPSTA